MGFGNRLSPNLWKIQTFARVQESTSGEGCNQVIFSVQSNTEQLSAESSIQDQSGYLIHFWNGRGESDHGHPTGFTDRGHRRGHLRHRRRKCSQKEWICSHHFRKTGKDGRRVGDRLSWNPFAEYLQSISSIRF